MTARQKIVDLAVETGTVTCPTNCPTLHSLQIGPEIWFDDALDMQDVYNASILFHEMTHYLQWAKSDFAQTCEEWKDREIMAYHWQNEVLVKSGRHAIQIPTMRCE
jgi:hypothetical protein